MARHKFPAGNKFAKGGLRDPPGGAPTNEEKAFKDLLKAAVHAEAIREVKKLAKRYIARGLKADKVLLHVIDRAIPAAKQEVEISGGVKIFRVIAPKYD
jgi:hypothetical protein